MSEQSKEEQMRRLIAEFRLMQGSSEALQQRLELLQTGMADLRVAETSLRGLRDLDEGAPILLPLGGGAFVDARLGDLSDVIVGIGANVSVEMGIDEALEDVTARLEEVEKANQSVQQQLQQILGQMRVHQDVINRLGAELQGEPPGV